MSFQTNQRQFLVDNSAITELNSSKIRMKTWNHEINDEFAYSRRFQRCQDKNINNFPTNPILTQRSLPTQHLQNILKQKQNIKTEYHQSRSNRTKSVLQQIKLDHSVISSSKYIPQTTRQLVSSQARKFGQPINKNQINKILGDVKITTSRITKNQQIYPFKQITEAPNPYFKSQFCTKKIDLSLKPEEKHQMGKRKISVKFIDSNQDLNQSAQYIQNNDKCNTARGQFGIFSTQSSIVDHKNIKKLATQTQTQAKRCQNYGVNTEMIKNMSVKTQTDEIYKNTNKIIEFLKNKIDQLLVQNKQMKNQLVGCTKQRDRLLNIVKQFQRKLSQKSNIQQGGSLKNIGNFSTTAQQQMNRQISLQITIQSLRKQIQYLKNGTGAMKMQQIIDSIKQQNKNLSLQLQGVSLRCRMFQQQNSENSSHQQQKRKLKMQIKHLKACMLDNKQQIDRLKGQNKKLKGRVQNNNLNNLSNSRAYTVWGSETDSLNLSISVVRQ